jgi:hypothetical protein
MMLLLLLSLAFAAYSEDLGSTQLPRVVIEGLDREAAIDTPQGIDQYSKHLIELLLGERAARLEPGVLNQRLARAEAMARNGKRRPIPYSIVAEAFNQMMQTISAPDSMRTTEEQVGALRTSLATVAPHLISIKTNRTACSPGEALFLIFQLVTNDGAAQGETTAPSPLPRMEIRSAPRPSALALLSRFLGTRTPNESRQLLLDVEQRLGF